MRIVTAAERLDMSAKAGHRWVPELDRGMEIGAVLLGIMNHGEMCTKFGHELESRESTS